MFQTCMNLFLTIFAADGIIKTYFDKKGPGFIKELGPHARFYSARNEGFAMGKLQDRPMIPKLVSCAAFLMVLLGSLASCHKKETPALVKLGFAIALAGAASNCADRLLRGYVVDYVNIRHGFLKKMIFNLSDVAILFGGILSTIGDLLHQISERHSIEKKPLASDNE